DPMTRACTNNSIFSPKEKRAFKIFVIEMVLIGAGLCWIAPTTSGRLAGVLFAAALVPVPPAVLYVCRKLVGRHIPAPVLPVEPAA
ncbi:MAG TPA: hypothetical protein VFE25_04370, partial [Opitutaceae bacterium]|nr:hypothetical protein [Opitutaceae bacterium]